MDLKFRGSQMSKEALKIDLLDNIVEEEVLNCKVKDQTGLNDFQKLPDESGVAIPKVGINRFRLPLLFQDVQGSLRSHDAHASMCINLPKGKTGINMSRLCSILQQESYEKSVNRDFILHVLKRYQDELRDHPDDQPFENAFIKLKFNYPVKQKSLRSDNWGWQYYDAALEGSLSADNSFRWSMTINYEYSSTCPCSLSMAKQYEKDYAEGKTIEGTGVAVAHGQRSNARVKVQLSPDADFHFEDLIQLLREAIPTETQSLVKRVDEQAFAILNGANPMFVEHASKRLYKALNGKNSIVDWIAEIEHYESLHSHNAAAVIYKGIDNGFHQDSIF
jgi:GTP cyclohydrolase I